MGTYFTFIKSICSKWLWIIEFSTEDEWLGFARFHSRYTYCSCRHVCRALHWFVTLVTWSLSPEKEPRWHHIIGMLTNLQQQLCSAGILSKQKGWQNRRESPVSETLQTIMSSYKPFVEEKSDWWNHNWHFCYKLSSRRCGFAWY